MENVKRVEFAGKVKRGDFKKAGVTLEKDRVIFTLPIASYLKGKLLLYAKDQKKIEQISIKEEYRQGNLASLTVYGEDIEKKYSYNYEIDGKLLQDPYALGIKGREVFAEERKEDSPVSCLMVKERDKGDKKRPPLPQNPSELLVYKLHPRGFTKSPDSKVKHPGTFLGIQEKLPYIEKLGVNAILLMPAYEFEEMPAKSSGGKIYPKKEKGLINYWGYKDGNYFVPKQSYAYKEDAKEEFKALIRRVHKKNMYFFMEFYFSGKIPSTMITEVLKYWKNCYGVDGFHILGEEIERKVIISDPWLSDSMLFFTSLEGLSLTEGIYSQYLGEYNCGFLQAARRLLKGDYKSLESFLHKAYKYPSPFYQVNYLADNDGFTLRDMVSYQAKHNEDNLEQNRDGSDNNHTWNCGEEGDSKKVSVKRLRMRQIKNALLLLYLSPGIPLLYAGDELGNSQNGNNNAYCQDNSTGWLTWDNKRQGKTLLAYVKKLIAFRKAHPFLTGGKGAKRQHPGAMPYPRISCHADKAWMAGGGDNPLYIGLMYGGDCEKDDKEELIYLACNFHWKSHSLALPKLSAKKKWYLAIDTQKSESFVEQAEIKEKEITVEPRTVKVLIGR